MKRTEKTDLMNERSAYNRRFGTMAGVTPLKVSWEIDRFVPRKTVSVPRHCAKPPPRCTTPYGQRHRKMRLKQEKNYY